MKWRCSHKSYCKPLSFLLAALAVMDMGPVSNLDPTLQDMQIIGRVLSFQENTVRGMVILAIVYNNADDASVKEAKMTFSLLGSGLLVGDLILKPVLVEQGSLAEASGYGAVLPMAGVNQGLLIPVLNARHVPCLTRHLDQVEGGTCIVAIRAAPSVSIVVNQTNAIAAGVHFATAFRMMVREI